MRESAWALGFLTLILSINSFASYYPYPESGYYGRSASSSIPVISLSLDQKEVLNTSFRIAAREDRLAEVRMLLQKGADVNSRSAEGETALMYAARGCRTDVIEVLIKSQADVNLQDSKGRSALIHAAMGACVDGVRALLGCPETRVEIRDDEKKRAVDYAEEGSLLELDGPSVDLFRLLRKVGMKKKFISWLKTSH